MNIKPFAVEEWMNAYEDGARYNIAETCVDSVSLDELFLLAGEDKQAFLERFCARRLTYSDIVGSEALREGVCGLYKSLKPDYRRHKLHSIVCCLYISLAVFSLMKLSLCIDKLKNSTISTRSIWIASGRSISVQYYIHI